MLSFTFSFIFLSATHAQADDSDIRLPIIKDHKLGYIDGSGTVVISPELHSVRAEYPVNYLFHDGLVAVQVNIGSSKLFGYMDKTGKFVIEPQFLSAGQFSCGLAYVEIGDSSKHGFINKQGEMVIELDPDIEAYDFREGFAQFLVTDKLLSTYKYGYINKAGKVAIKPKYIGSMPFSEGLAGVIRHPSMFEQIIRCVNAYVYGLSPEVKIGFINRRGKMVIKPESGRVDKFSEGLARIQISVDDDTDKMGFINRKGDIMIEPQYFEVKAFSEGLAAVEVTGERGNKKWGYIDSSGKMVIQPQFPFVESFSEGLAAAYKNKEKGRISMGYINKNGIFEFESDFLKAGPFINGFACVSVYYPSEEEIKYAWIDKSGNYIWEPSN